MATSLLLLRSLKFAFGFSFVVTMTVVVTLMTNWKYESDDEVGDIVQLDVVPARSRAEQLDDNYPNCVRNPTKEFCLLTADHQLLFLQDDDRGFLSNSAANRGAPEFRRRHPIESAIFDFIYLMQQLNTEAVLIEPSILFCTLSTDRKLLLKRRGFNLASAIGARNVVNFAFLEPNMTELENSGGVIESAGFVHIPVKADHHFFLRRMIVVHAVVFRRRAHYLWHSALRTVPEEVSRLAAANKILFSAVDSSYEKFDPMLLEMNDVRAFGLRIPSQPSEFLLQIASSRFLKCSPSKSPAFGKGKMATLKRLFLTTLNRLKAIFHPLLVDFWILQRTLSDWHFHCNSTYYITSINFATWKIDDDFRNYFENFGEDICRWSDAEESEIKAPYEWTFSCLGHKIKLLFLFKTAEASWFLRQDGEDGIVKYKYPSFELCSADAFGHRTSIPCNPEEIIRTENEMALF